MKIAALHAAVEQDEEGVVIPILDPLGEPYQAADGSDVTWTVLGTQSKAMKKAADAQTRRYIKQASQTTDVEDIRRDRIRKALAGSIAWHGFEDDDNQPVPFSPENARLVLEADERVLLQVEQGQAKHAAFLAAAKAS